MDIGTMEVCEDFKTFQTKCLHSNKRISFSPTANIKTISFSPQPTQKPFRLSNPFWEENMKKNILFVIQGMISFLYLFDWTRADEGDIVKKH